MKKNLLLISCLLLFLSAVTACKPAEKTPLVVFAAGSLIGPFNDLEKAFEASHPDVDVQMEYHGSIQVIRHASELHEPIDIVASADYNLIPMLMYEVNDPDTGVPYASWYLHFASNRLALAYTSTSANADEINAENWYKILSDPEVKVGIADPRFDASGYRALMLVKLAEAYYGEKTIFAHIFGGQFQYPIRWEVIDGVTEIRVPEILETKTDAHVVLRGSSMMLLALLQSGDLDYAFEYESVTQQQGLKLVQLPDEINMGNANFAEQYAKVLVKEDFQRFATVNPVFKGDQIGYGLTIPSNAAHLQEAVEFIKFLLSAEGREIMEKNSHPLFDQVLADHIENVPTELQSLVISEK